MRFFRKVRFWCRGVWIILAVAVVVFVLVLRAAGMAPFSRATEPGFGVLLVQVVLLGATTPLAVPWIIHTWRQCLRRTGSNTCPMCGVRRAPDADRCPKCSALHPAPENIARWRSLFFRSTLIPGLPMCGPDVAPRSAAAQWEHRSVCPLAGSAVLFPLIAALVANPEQLDRTEVWVIALILAITFFLPLLAFAVIVLLARRAAMPISPHCEYCGYANVNKDGLAHCPECGNPASVATKAPTATAETSES